MISEVDHVAVTVRDIEKSIHFYRDVLEMEVMLDAEFSGKEMEALLGILPGERLRAVVLKKGERMKGMVELLSFSAPGKPITTDKKLSNVGLSLLSFEVDDIEKVYAELGEKGVKFNCQIQTFYTKPGAKRKAVTLRDPNGVLIELVQRF